MPCSSFGRAAEDLEQLKGSLRAVDEERARLLDKLERLNAKRRALFSECCVTRIISVDDHNGVDRGSRTATAVPPYRRRPGIAPPDQLALDVWDADRVAPVAENGNGDGDDEDEDEPAAPRTPLVPCRGNYNYWHAIQLRAARDRINRVRAWLRANETTGL